MWGLLHKRNLDYFFFCCWVLLKCSGYNNIQSLNFYQMIYCKITKKVYTCEKLEVFFPNLIPKDTVSHLHFCLEFPSAGRVCGLHHLSKNKFTLA